MTRPIHANSSGFARGKAVKPKPVCPQGMDKTEWAIIQLMSRCKLNWAWKIEPEQRLCIEFADMMRQLTLSGAYKGIWMHVPNEGLRHAIVGAILKAMGLIPGTVDYVFVWSAGKLVIEFKVPGKKIIKDSNQDYFRLWCERAGIPHTVAHSKEEALDKLRALGAI